MSEIRYCPPDGTAHRLTRYPACPMAICAVILKKLPKQLRSHCEPLPKYPHNLLFKRHRLTPLWLGQPGRLSASWHPMSFLTKKSPGGIDRTMFQRLAVLWPV